MVQKPKNKQVKPTQKKHSKQQKRFKLIVYLMILAMLLTSLTTGLAMFL
ncbi:stressosome-associated protein Prli42 [Lentibacillus daqui]|nr:stressosome-associated protein Prli42 [Lentibacillus daqui]